MLKDLRGGMNCKPVHIQSACGRGPCREIIGRGQSQDPIYCTGPGLRNEGVDKGRAGPRRGHRARQRCACRGRASGTGKRQGQRQQGARGRARCRGGERHGQGHGPWMQGQGQGAKAAIGSFHHRQHFRLFCRHPRMLHNQPHAACDISMKSTTPFQCLPQGCGGRHCDVRCCS